MYKNDIFSLFETSQIFIYAFWISKNHFPKTGLLNFIKAVLFLFAFLGFISSMELLIEG